MANKWMRKLGMGMSVIMTVSQMSGMVSFAASEEDGWSGEDFEMEEDLGNEEDFDEEDFFEGDFGNFEDVLKCKVQEEAFFDENFAGSDDESPVIVENEDEVTIETALKENEDEPISLGLDDDENEDEIIYIKGVSYNYTSCIAVGETKQGFTIEPENYTAPVTIRCSDESVLSVDKNGVFTGISQGSAVVWVEAYGITVEMYVAVVGEAPQVLIYNYWGADSNVGYPGSISTTYPYIIIAKVYSEEGEEVDEGEYSLVWSSEDETIATVTEEGIVTGLTPGTVRIKAEIDGCEESCGYYIMEFQEPQGPYDHPYDPNWIDMGNVKVPGDRIVVGVGETVAPEYHIYPENFNQKIYFADEEPGIASVDENGNVTGHALGRTYIKISNFEDIVGNVIYIDVYVTDGHRQLFIHDYKVVWVGIGMLDNPKTVAIVSDNEEDQNLTVKWESSDESIATIDQNGEIEYLKRGVVCFTARLEEDPDVYDKIYKIVCAGTPDDIIFLEGIEEDIINDVVGEIRNNDINEMQAVLEESTEAQEHLKELEETYNNKNNIVVSENSTIEEFPEDGVEIIGAGLNALEEGTELNLEITSTEKEIGNVGEDSAVIAFDMGLYNSDQSEDKVDLSIPVIVTLPVPDDVDKESLEVRHLADNGVEEIITPILTEDESGVVLTLSHFSTFAFVWNKEKGSVSEEKQHEGFRQSEDGSFYYYKYGEIDNDMNGYVDWDGSKFFVTNGKLDTNINGVMIDGTADPLVWYYCSNGQVQTQHKGLAEYDGEWFYIENGKVTTDKNAFVEYDGGLFAVAVGRIVSEYSGLMQDPSNPQTGDWYFFANGQAQIQYTGLAMYDDVWFYVVNGKLAQDYTGNVDYDGSSFYVENGMVK